MNPAPFFFNRHSPIRYSLLPMSLSVCLTLFLMAGATQKIPNQHINPPLLDPLIHFVQKKYQKSTRNIPCNLHDRKSSPNAPPTPPSHSRCRSPTKLLRKSNSYSMEMQGQRRCKSLPKGSQMLQLQPEEPDPSELDQEKHKYGEMEAGYSVKVLPLQMAGLVIFLSGIFKSLLKLEVNAQCCCGNAHEVRHAGPVRRDMSSVLGALLSSTQHGNVTGFHVNIRDEEQSTVYYSDNAVALQEGCGGKSLKMNDEAAAPAFKAPRAP